MLLRWEHRAKRPWSRLRSVLVLFLTVLAVAAIYVRFELGITGFGPPQLSFQEHQHDLGQLRSPNQVEYRFTFSNTGQQPVQIDGVHAVAPSLSECSCGMDLLTGSVSTDGTGGLGATPINSALVSSHRVMPGETGDVTVRFNRPTIGRYDGLIQVRSNDPAEPTQSLSLTFDVVQ